MVVNFFKACRDYPDQLAAAGQEIQHTGDCVEDARRFLVRCAQGFGSKLADRVGWKNTKQSAGPINPVVWNRLPDYIINAAARLKNAQIEDTDAVQLIRSCNCADCLVYADPPYMGALRNNKRIYRREMMSEASHIDLLHALMDHKGYVVLSGYDNDFYNAQLAGWHKASKAGRANNAALRYETIWMNFETQMQFNFMER
jgi:DNA adenine methylase